MSKADQSQSAPDGAPVVNGRKPRRSKVNAPDHQIDIRRILEEPIRITKDGRSRPVAPFEALMRQHFRKSIVERSMASMKFIFDLAEKYEVIKRPPPPLTGGTFIVPKELPDDLQREIFGYLPPVGENDSMHRITSIIRRFYDRRPK